MIAMKVKISFYNSSNVIETHTLDFIHIIKIYEFQNKNYIEFIRTDLEYFKYDYDKVTELTITK